MKIFLNFRKTFCAEFAGPDIKLTCQSMVPEITFGIFTRKMLLGKFPVNM